jgi:hypothetical protein
VYCVVAVYVELRLRLRPCGSSRLWLLFLHRVLLCVGIPLSCSARCPVPVPPPPSGGAPGLWPVAWCAKFKTPTPAKSSWPLASLSPVSRIYLMGTRV